MDQEIAEKIIERLDALIVFAAASSQCLEVLAKRSAGVSHSVIAYSMERRKLEALEGISEGAADIARLFADRSPDETDEAA